MQRLSRRQSAPALASVTENDALSVSASDDDGECECEKDDEIRKLQARLRAFYWAHDPRQVDKVDEILERHKGKEEAFIQRMHMQFGVRDFSGEVAIDDIYEHERYSYFSFSYGSSFPGHLLPTDRRRWSGLHGTPSSQTREKVEPQLPVNWVWTSSWEIDTESGNCDSDGWTYAFDFTMMNHALKRNGGRKEPRSTDYVRRRRWIRRRQRVARTNALPSTAKPLRRTRTAPSQESEVDDSDDDTGDTGASLQQIEAAATDLSIDDDDGDAGDGDEVDELQGNNQEDALNSPPLSMNNSGRSKLPSLSPSLQSALRPPTQTDQKSGGAAIEAHPLQIFHMDMEKSAIDAAWNLAVKQLETMYTRAKNHETAKKKQWRMKREKMLRQIHLLEKTIASMQTVAQEEERKRRASSSANSSPRGKTSFSLQSPNGGGSPRSPGTDNLKSPRASQHAEAKNAVNVINLAAKMKCAQSKLDALKRLFWHPREKKYTLRFSIDGIFYGLRDFFVETFKSSFHISVNHQTNGAQGITPTCKIVMKGHTVCCGKHVKVTGDKGTRVPKSIWERMYLDTDFEASIYLIYVEDINDGTSTKLRSGSWEFLFNPESTRVELSNFTRRVNGGLDLPEPVVRKLCSDVLSSLVRDLALIYFPQELAVAFDAPPAKLDLEGELEITGLPIDDVMEREIEYISDTTPESPTPSASSAQEENSSTSNLVIAAATQLLSSFLHSDVYMKRIAAALSLSPAQFNLLVALKECGLYPAPYSIKTIATMCEYYSTFFIEEKVASGEDDHIEKLRMVWKQVLELLYIRKMKAAGAGRGVSFAGTAQASSNGNGNSCSPFALFSMDNFFDTIARLTKKPVALQMTVKRLHCSVNALSVVEAVSKLYERLVLGVDFSKPRTGYDSFMYGFRFGRKATVSTAVANVVADATTPKNGASAMLPLDPRLHVQMDAVFRARLKAFSQFFRTLKALLEFVKQNMDHVNAEMVGSLKGSGTDCDVNGSFKDVEYVGPVNAALGVSACFLGLYKVETVALDDGRVGLQVELMLPKAEAAHQKRLRGKSATMSALESVCKFVASDLSTQVMIDVDALLEDHRLRSASNAAEMTAPWSPTKSFARKVETQKTNQRHQAFSFSFDSNANANEVLTSNDNISVTKVNSATSLNAGPFGKLKVAASAFTKLHTNVKSGSFSTRVVPILNWFIAKQLRPLVLKSFPEHIVLFDSVVASSLQWISSAQMELDFDVLAKVFLHNHENDLMFTFCGSPLHPTPIVYKDELFLLPLILHVDDLVNLWIDDRYPPYANPLYF
uniref:Peroxin/Ferlin domain-containing protein n=1 Tax=Globisporangium ultimum (strain ATCC 200006 / CBS 805.95 / DAOM BR144) TaxID=431595 RepID=K3X852_GLOUD